MSEIAAATGYAEIARLVGRALSRSVSARTAKRWARAADGDRPRLPVFIHTDGQAYIMHDHLTAFVAAWTITPPLGGRLPRGARVSLPVTARDEIA